MPNHCYNEITISHDDPDTMKRLKEGLEEYPSVFFARFVPCPENEKCVSYWGTKWDVYDVDIDKNSDNNAIYLSFNTAWSPPTKAYDKLKKLGFEINANFMEIGCDFCGFWIDGEETIYNNVIGNLKNIPEDFHSYFKEYEEEKEEEEKEEEEK